MSRKRIPEIGKSGIARISASISTRAGFESGDRMACRKGEHEEIASSGCRDDGGACRQRAPRPRSPMAAEARTRSSSQAPLPQHRSLWSSTTTTKSGKSARKSKKSRAGKTPTATGSITSTATTRPTISSSNGTYRRTTRVLSRAPHHRNAEPFERDWLGVFFGRSNVRRFAIAFAASIALHEIAAGVIPRNPATAPARREIVTRVQLLRVVNRAAVKPAPRPRRSDHLARSVAAAARAHRDSRMRSKAERSATRSGRAPVGRRRPERYGAKPVWDVGPPAAPESAPPHRRAARAVRANGAGTTGSGSGAATGTNHAASSSFPIRTAARSMLVRVDSTSISGCGCTLPTARRSRWCSTTRGTTRANPPIRGRTKTCAIPTSQRVSNRRRKANSPTSRRWFAT